MDFIGSLPSSTARFVVVVPGSPTALQSSMSGTTLREAGLSQPITLRINWLEDEDIIDNEVGKLFLYYMLL